MPSCPVLPPAVTSCAGKDAGPGLLGRAGMVAVRVGGPGLAGRRRPDGADRRRGGEGPRPATWWSSSNRS